MAQELKEVVHSKWEMGPSISAGGRHKVRIRNLIRRMKEFRRDLS